MSTPIASPVMIHMIEAVPDRLEGSPRQVRRFWSDEFKVDTVAEACKPGVNNSELARRIGITPSQLYRWRRDLLKESELHHIATAEKAQRSVVGVSSVVEVVIGDVVIRAGADTEEAHLQRVIRAVRSA